MSDGYPTLTDVCGPLSAEEHLAATADIIVARVTDTALTADTLSYALITTEGETVQAGETLADVLTTARFVYGTGAALIAETDNNVRTGRLLVAALF